LNAVQYKGKCRLEIGSKTPLQLILASLDHDACACKLGCLTGEHISSQDDDKTFDHMPLLQVCNKWKTIEHKEMGSKERKASSFMPNLRRCRSFVLSPLCSLLLSPPVRESQARKHAHVPAYPHMLLGTHLRLCANARACVGFADAYPATSSLPLFIHMCAVIL
jgi:hypothetical protein